MTHQTTPTLPYPRGFLRLLLRLPLYLYRFGLGDMVSWMPFVVVTTRGRTSGRPRHVVLEYRRHGSKYYLVSGWGNRPDWLKNLLADPEVTLRRGGRTYSARAAVVTDSSEAMRALYKFRLHSPFYGRMMALMSSADDITLKTLADVAEEFTVIRLDICDDPPRLPSIPTDRAWVGPAAIMAAVVLLVIRLARTRNDS